MLLALLLVAPLSTAPTPFPAASFTPSSAPSPLLPTSAVAKERVEVKTADRVVLVGDYYPPKDDSQRAPGALLVHDAGQSRGQFENIAARLVKLGFAVLAVDLRGHGESATEESSWAELDEEGRESLWAFATRDLEAAARFLRDKREVHATNLNLVGVRAGCTLVVRHALRDENVRSLGLLAPQAQELGFDLEEDIQELAGLPVYMVAKKKERKQADQIVDIAHAAAGGRPFIELSISKARSDDVMDDKKLGLDLAKWFKDKAFPKRGPRDR